MPLPTNDAIAQWVAQHIGELHAKRLTKLVSLNLREVLKRKNPYLFRAKNLLTAEQLVRALLDAYLSSQEETVFGDFLELLAIWINTQTLGGRKSSASASISNLIETISATSWRSSPVRTGATLLKSKR